jgi:hypothetical protein
MRVIFSRTTGKANKPAVFGGNLEHGALAPVLLMNLKRVDTRKVRAVSTVVPRTAE